MKNFNFLSKILSPVMLIPLLILGCEEVDTGMESRIVDMNYRITAIDKLAAEPGDTITFTGVNLDQVFKIMLNTDNLPITYSATPTELRMVLPAMAPLGDVNVINIFFSGKGLAQRAITIMSSSVILTTSPSTASRPGDVIRVYGLELHLAQDLYVGEVKAESFRLISDRILEFTHPAGSIGGRVKLVTAAGSEALSPDSIVLGREILVHNFNEGATLNHFINWSANGNMGPTDAITHTDRGFPFGRYITIPIVDRATGWGGNFDLFLQNMPNEDHARGYLYVEIMVSKRINVNVMVQNPANVFGRTFQQLEPNVWNQIRLPFAEMGTGYGSTEPFGAVPPFNTLTAVKIQPDARAVDGNFGQTVSLENVKLVIVD